MIQIIPSAERHHQNFGWLDTRWHFSFDTYHDPANLSWGPLRVFNDDVIQPGQGFGSHPHRDMEIITVVLEGALEHRDNQGHHGVIEAGEVQMMRAGTGIVHSEFNHSKADPVHLLQLWILPRTRGLKPGWEQHRFTREDRLGKLLPVVSSGDKPGTLAIDQDAVIYLGSLRGGEQVIHTVQPNRRTYLFLISGSLALNGTPLAAGDQARIANEAELRLQGQTDSELILLDLPY